jgi:hypothetical protein
MRMKMLLETGQAAHDAAQNKRNNGNDSETQDNSIH